MTDHKKGQYALPDGTHSNTVESAFSLLKRGIYGTFHNVSRKHLHRYVAEFDFRWNARKVDDGERLTLPTMKTQLVVPLPPMFSIANFFAFSTW